LAAQRRVHARGRYLATANEDGTVYVLRLAAPGELVGQAAPETDRPIDPIP